MAGLVSKPVCNRFRDSLDPRTVGAAPLLVHRARQERRNKASTRPLGFAKSDRKSNSRSRAAPRHRDDPADNEDNRAEHRIDGHRRRRDRNAAAHKCDVRRGLPHPLRRGVELRDARAQIFCDTRHCMAVGTNVLQLRGAQRRRVKMAEGQFEPSPASWVGAPGRALLVGGGSGTDPPEVQQAR
jgi:hypothetical protein